MMTPTAQASNRGGAAKPPSSTGGGNVVASGGEDGPDGPRIPPESGSGAAGEGPSMPPLDQLEGRPLGRVLTKMGKVTREQVMEGMSLKGNGDGRRIGAILVGLGHVSDRDVLVALGAQKGARVSEDELASATLPPAESFKGLPIGRVLRAMGKINAEDLLHALDVQRERGGKLGEILIKRQLVSDVDIRSALAQQRAE